MEASSNPPSLHRCNVLALDGGGVRGLSSLLILGNLMEHINKAIRGMVRDAKTPEKVEPQEVFDLVVGTSTGGLIAIMLGKLRMSPQQCIQAYKDISKDIFGKKHKRGRITAGLVKPRYSGTRLGRCIRDLILEKNFDVTIEMASDNNDRGIACAVVCREHTEQSIYSELKEGPVFICSLQCPKQVRCCVSEAARATSAALTYFRVQKIGERYFIDGGIEFNNPSKAILDHNTEFDRVSASRGCAGNSEEAARGARHAHLDLSRARFINLGTGDKPKNRSPRKRDVLAEFLVPGFIRMGIFLKNTLTEIAVESENIAGHMVSLARVSNEDSNIDLRYERFSADNGVCYIKLDKHKELEQIEDLTMKYIRHSTTQTRLRKLGEDIARDYLQKSRYGAATEPVPSTGVTVPETNTLKSPNSPSQRLQSPEPSIRVKASTNGSSEYANGATPGTEDPSTRGIELSASSTAPVQCKMSNGHFPADAPLEEPEAMPAPI